MTEHETAATVCRAQHPLEWAAPTPRTRACGDCTRSVAQVFTVLLVNHILEATR